MAGVIESFSKKDISQTTSHTVTAPTGITVGDRLVVDGGCLGAGTPTMDVPAGWTKLVENSNTNHCATILYKIADSGDAAAGSFSFSFNTGANVHASVTMWRCSGIAVTSTNTGQTDTATGTSATIGITPHNFGGIIFYRVYSITGGTATKSYSDYTITGGTNPTWTEAVDFFDSANSDYTISIAGVYNSRTTSTALSATKTGAGTDFSSGAGVMAHFPSEDDSANTEFVSSTQQSFDPAGRADTYGTLGFSQSTQQAFDPTGRATSPTQWTNEAEENTTWTNESSIS